MGVDREAVDEVWLTPTASLNAAFALLDSQSFQVTFSFKFIFCHCERRQARGNPPFLFLF